MGLRKERGEKGGGGGWFASRRRHYGGSRQSYIMGYLYKTKLLELRLRLVEMLGLMVHCYQIRLMRVYAVDKFVLPFGFLIFAAVAF